MRTYYIDADKTKILSNFKRLIVYTNEIDEIHMKGFKI